MTWIYHLKIQINLISRLIDFNNSSTLNYVQEGQNFGLLFRKTFFFVFLIVVAGEVEK
jgi:hypothetical protein